MPLAIKKWVIRSLVMILTCILIIVFLFFWTLKRRADQIGQAAELLLVLTVYAVDHGGLFPIDAFALEREGYVTRESGSENSLRVRAGSHLCFKPTANSCFLSTLHPHFNIIDLQEFTVTWGLDIKQVDIINSHTLVMNGKPIWLLRRDLYDPDKEQFIASAQVDWVKNIKMSLAEKAQAATQISETDRKNGGR